MNARCNPANSMYRRNYSDRGITVCSEWQHSYPTFRDWALANGFREHVAVHGEKNTTLDRYPDQNGNYEPSNCRWATRKLQARNMRRNTLLTAFGETKTLVEWSEDSRCVVSWAALRDRVQAEWQIEEALTKPKMSPGTYREGVRSQIDRDRGPVKRVFNVGMYEVDEDRRGILLAHYSDLWGWDANFCEVVRELMREKVEELSPKPPTSEASPE